MEADGTVKPEVTVVQEKRQGRRGDIIDKQRLNSNDSKGWRLRVGGMKTSLVSVLRGGGTGQQVPEARSTGQATTEPESA